jgi:hypothetical protein
VAYVWGLFDQDIAHEQVEETSYILCWAAKWYGNGPIEFCSVYQTSRRRMLRRIHTLLDEAEVVIHFNGLKFDIPTLNKEFIKHGMAPPSPYKQVDLYRVVKGMFRFESNKMTAITKQLELGTKLKHQGFELWVGCMKGVQAAWGVMERYNKRDVRIMERLYTKLLPWIPNHPHQGLDKSDACPRCGVPGRMQRRGTSIARTLHYQRYQCQACGGWSRSRLSRKATKPLYV